MKLSTEMTYYRWSLDKMENIGKMEAERRQNRLNSQSDCKDDEIQEIIDGKKVEK